MPSKKRKRKSIWRKLQLVKPEAWLWALFLVNFSFGAVFSPLTSVRKVRIVGPDTGDQERMTEEAQRLRDVPLLRLNRTWVESRLANNSEIDTLQFSPNIFGRAVVHVALKTAVAKLATPHMFLDPSGDPFLSNRDFGELPEVIVPPNTFSPSLTIVGGWECGPTAQLCQILSAQVPNVACKVELTDRGVLSLYIDNGAEVVLGSSDNLPRKIEKLKALLDEKPGLLKSVRQLNLTSPEAPMVVRG